MNENLLCGIPHIESPFFNRIFSESTNPELRYVALELAIKGYAIIDFPDADFEHMSDRVKNDLHSHYDFDNWRTHGHAAGISLRVQDA